jgi:hypothetical protein
VQSNIEPSLSRTVWMNCAVVSGIVIGLWSTPQSLSDEATGRIAVFFLAVFNLLFLVAQPRLAQRSSDTRSTLFKETWVAITERPLVTVLVAMQLWAVAQCVGTSIAFGKAYATPEAVAKNLQGRVLLGCALMSAVAVLWLIAAVGLWRTRVWARWLALALNGMAVGLTTFIQLFKRDEFLIDVVSAVMVVLLLLPTTRRIFKSQ